MDATRTLIYLVGEAGVGKSTAMAKATEGWTRESVELPIPHDVLSDELGPFAIELGRWRGAASGTDALDKAIQRRAEAYIEDGPETPIVIGEGARLGYIRFLGTALAKGWRVVLVHLVSDRAPDQRAARVASQNATWVKGRSAKGLPQSESWVKGTATRARNLAANADLLGIEVLTVDGEHEDAPDILRKLIEDAQ